MTHAVTARRPDTHRPELAGAEQAAGHPARCRYRHDVDGSSPVAARTSSSRLAAAGLAPWVSTPDGDVWIGRAGTLRHEISVVVPHDHSRPATLSLPGGLRNAASAELPVAVAVAVTEALAGTAEPDAWATALSCADTAVSHAVREAASAPGVPDEVRAIVALS